MGFEVLDGGAPVAQAPAAPAPDVVALDDLDRLDEPAARTARRWSDWWAGLGSSRQVGAVAAATLVGLGVGATSATYWAGLTREQERRSTVAAVAVATGATTRDHGSHAHADVTIALTNVGPLPIEVAESAPGARATFDRPVVEAYLARVQPGAREMVEVRLRVDCSSDAQVDVALPVRTVDGTVHRLPVRRGAQLPTSVTGHQLCEAAPTVR